MEDAQELVLRDGNDALARKFRSLATIDEHESSARATYRQSFAGASGTVVLERKVKK
jgi:hypothetical protein